MANLGYETESSSTSLEGMRSPNENDILISRLVARIAELEERLYKQELEKPAIGQRTPLPSATFAPTVEVAIAPAANSVPGTVVGPSRQGSAPTPKFKEAFLATLRESWARFENVASTPINTPPPPTARPAQYNAEGGASSSVAPRALWSPTRLGSTSLAVAAAEARKIWDAAASGRGGAPGEHAATPADAAASQSQVKQEADFNFSTHLVVDYTKPNHEPESPKAAIDSARSRGAESAISQTQISAAPSDLSSVDSCALGYGSAAAADRARQRAQDAQMLGIRTEPEPEATGDSAMAAATTQPVQPGSADAASGRPPLPPTRGFSSDGGAGGSGSGGGGSNGGQPQSGGGGPSRAAVWSGTVLSKLGLTWGRDRERDRGEQRDAGNGLPRHGSNTNLQTSPYPNATDAFSNRALEEQLVAGASLGPVSGGGIGAGDGNYYRYVLDPADVQAEMEVTARVRRAAAEALMEANNKLAEAQAAARELAHRAEQAKQLEQELKQLRSERSAAQAAKDALAADMAAVQRQLEAMKETESSLQSELEQLRGQADIWRSNEDGGAEKLKAENALMRKQLTNRMSELQACRTRLSEGEAERQRLVRETQDLQNKIQWLTKINLQLETAAGQLDGARKAATEWQERFHRERAVRRRLHDQLQQLRGNIRVVCRVRPVQGEHPDIVSYPLEGLLGLSPPDRRYQEFEFDTVFPPSSGQAAVFEEGVAPLVRSVADGHNAVILAYGQTGSGKTHTMLGPPEDPGIYMRALRELFRIATEEDAGTAPITVSGTLTPAALLAAAAATPTTSAFTTPTSAFKSRSRRASLNASSGGALTSDADPAAGSISFAGSVASSGNGVGGSGSASASGVASDASSPGGGCLGRFSFEVAMLDIYNEAAYDLLAGPGEDGALRALEVSSIGPGELPSGHDRVSGLTWRPVASCEACEAVLAEGATARDTAAAALNIASSRSHAVLSVRVTMTLGDRRRTVSMLHMVDLAGSERVSKSEASEQQLREAQCIGRSLGALGDVINALQRRSGHVPFRNSKLTAVLQDSLCDSSKVLLMCNIAPENVAANETLCSLSFASRAAQVELGDVRRASQGSADRAAAIATAAAAATSQTSALPAAAPPPLPIMNGTAAKVRAQAAAAAAAAGSSGGGGAVGTGMRSSQSWAGSVSSGGFGRGPFL